MFYKWCWCHSELIPIKLHRLDGWYVNYVPIKFLLNREKYSKRCRHYIFPDHSQRTVANLHWRRALSSMVNDLVWAALSRMNPHRLCCPLGLCSCMWLSVHVYTTNEDWLEPILNFHLVGFQDSWNQRSTHLSARLHPHPRVCGLGRSTSFSYTDSTDSFL